MIGGSCCGLKKLLIVLIAAPLLAVFLRTAEAGLATHVVISEIQVAGGNKDDEFIELYNPTSTAVDISGWSIQYRGGAASGYDKKNFETGDSIPAYGFFLIVNSTSYDGGVTADLTYSAGTIALSGVGGTVFLVNNKALLTNPNDASIIDKVAYGTGTLFPETAAASLPADNGSIERKPGAAQPDKGNGEDTDDNSADFDTRTTSEPQNTSSPTEQPPTSITLSSLTAHPIASQPTSFRWPWLAVAVGLVFGGVAVARRLLICTRSWLKGNRRKGGVV